MNHYTSIKYTFILCFSSCSALKWLALDLERLRKWKLYKESIILLYSIVDWNIFYQYICHDSRSPLFLTNKSFFFLKSVFFNEKSSWLQIENKISQSESYHLFQFCSMEEKVNTFGENVFFSEGDIFSRLAIMQG